MSGVETKEGAAVRSMTPDANGTMGADANRCVAYRRTVSVA